MHRTKISRVAILAFFSSFAIILGFDFLRGLFSDEVPLVVAPKESSIAQSVLPELLPFTREDFLVERERDEAEQLVENLRKLNPRNDWCGAVLSEPSLDFSNLPELAGIELLDQIPEIGFIRFAIIDPMKAIRVLPELIELDSFSPNHSLRSPLPPRELSGEEENGFEDGFLSWLGGRSDRSAMGRGIKVALLDSGIDSTHPLLVNSSLRENDLLTDSAEEDASHGTALASVIAGMGDGFEGVAPASEVLSYRVIDDTGHTDSHTVARAIVLAVNEGAKVINLSLGGEQPNQALESSVRYALENGVSLVAAVGNEGMGLVDYPAAYEGVIGVTSVGVSGRVSEFANFGDEVDLSAPGDNVLTAWSGGEMVGFSGTSIATAIVSGAIAAELSRDPLLSPPMIEELLYRHANESEIPGVDPYAGRGVLSLARLENRSKAEYSDPAIAGYHFPAVPEAGSGIIPFEVMVQNQGNTWQGNLELIVEYLGQRRDFRIDNLAPGALHTKKLYLQGGEAKDGMQVNARLIQQGERNDQRLDNNQRSSIIRF